MNTDKTVDPNLLSCECRMHAAPGFLYSGLRQDGERWVCPNCALVWVHVCDEAEGCSWLPAYGQAPTGACAPRHAPHKDAEPADSRVWLVGVLSFNSWMCEGVFLSEPEAIENCKHDEFIVLVKVGERLPQDVREAACIYWPQQETKEVGLARLNKYRAAMASIQHEPNTGNETVEIPK